MRPASRRPALLLPLTAMLVLPIACDDDDGDDDGVSGEDAATGSAGSDDASTGPGDDDSTMQARCDTEDRDDDFALGLSHAGTTTRVAIADADPALPIRGDNAWTIEITDSSGAVMTGLDLSVGPWMPDHGHGSPVQVNVTELEGGQYLVEPLNLFMAGYWEVTVEIADPEDAVVFKVCVE